MRGIRQIYGVTAEEGKNQEPQKPGLKGPSSGRWPVAMGSTRGHLNLEANMDLGLSSESDCEFGGLILPKSKIGCRIVAVSVDPGRTPPKGGYRAVKGLCLRR